MESINQNPATLSWLRRCNQWATDPFVLLDVGCAGGIHPAWFVFGNDLRAHGFDMKIEEIQRIRVENQHPHVHYHSYAIGLPLEHEFHQLRTQSPNDEYFMPWNRLSSTAAQTIHARREPSPPVPLTTARISLAEFAAQQRLDHVDFIKIDTDGFDFEALLSAESLFDSHQVLGVQIEAPFIGSGAPTANTFHNMDRLMRSRGFVLFGLDCHRYSRTALPAPFVWDIYAQTAKGQPIWADAVYLRDAAAPGYHELWGSELPLSKILKLVALFDIYGLQDCAAELILQHQNLIKNVIDPNLLLDALTPRLCQRTLNYKDYCNTFNEHPDYFLPSGYSKLAAFARWLRRGIHRVATRWIRKIIPAAAPQLSPEEWDEIRAPVLSPPPATAMIPTPGWSRFYSEEPLLEEELERRRLQFARMTTAKPMRWIEDLRIYIYPGNEMSRALFISGLYEPNDLLQLDRLLRPGDTFIDIGANMGIYALLAAKKVATTGQVHAFEPSPREWKRLQENIALNHLQQIRANPCAVSNQLGTLTLKIASDKHAGHNTLASRLPYGGPTLGLQPVPVTTLDHYCQENKLTQVDLIKIDVEGAEAFVLAGARETLKRFRPHLIIEVLDGALACHGVVASEIESMLRDCGYEFYSVSEANAELILLEHFGLDRSANVVAIHREKASLARVARQAA